MSLKIILTLATVLVVFFTVDANPELGFPLLKTNALFECGGVVTDNSKPILYKMFEQVGDNERCVWIVATPYAASYNVRVTSDFEFKDGFLNVGALTRGNALNYTYQFNNSWTWSTVEANILVITFQSPQNSNIKGFALEYEMVNTTRAYSPNSSHLFVSLDTIYLKFPFGRELYDNYELSTLVYPLGNNVHQEGVFRYLVYKLIRLESFFFDFVEVYSFNSAENEFVSIGNATGGYQYDSRQFSSDDMIIVTFHSDHSNPYGGFSLSSVVANFTCSN